MKKSFHYINSPHREGAEVDPMFTPRVARVRKAQYLRNENIIPGTVTGVLVCVNYSDYLVHCIDANHDKLGKIIVVTTPEDVDTQRVCTKYNNVEVVKTNCFYEGGCTFDKGKALNMALDRVERHRDSWVLIHDADIVLPVDFRAHLRGKLNSMTLYGAPRHFAYSFQDYVRFRDTGATNYNILRDYYSPGRFPIGYFQLFNSLHLLGKGFEEPYPEGHDDASYTDLQFTKKFKIRDSLRNVHTVHLGPSMVNHRGRVTPFFGTQSTHRDVVLSKNPRGRTLEDILSLQRSMTVREFSPELISQDGVEFCPDLAIVTCYFNPHKNKNIRTNYHVFKEYMSHHAKLFTVELVMDGDDPELSAAAEDHIVVRGSREKHSMFQKECLLNIGAQYVVKNYDYPCISWADADVLSVYKDWTHRCVEKLKTTLVVQPFSGSCCLDHNMRVTDETHEARNLSSMRYWEYMGRPDAWGMTYFSQNNYKSKSGLIWAARREFFEEIGLLWQGFIGNGDALMAGAFTDCKDWWLVHTSKVYGDAFIPFWAIWGNRVRSLASRINVDTVSYSDGMFLHLNHGRFARRKYAARNKLITDVGCDITKDVQLNPSGLMEFTEVGELKGLPQITYDYFQGRHEDEFLNNYENLSIQNQ